MNVLTASALVISFVTQFEKPASCISRGQAALKDAAKSCPLAFSGRVITSTRVQSRLGDEFSTIIYKVVPTKIWRGSITDTITLTGHRCSYVLENGRNYILLSDSKLDSRHERIVSNNLETEASQLDKLFAKRRFQHFQPAE